MGASAALTEQIVRSPTDDKPGKRTHDDENAPDIAGIPEEDELFGCDDSDQHHLGEVYTEEKEVHREEDNRIRLNYDVEYHIVLENGEMVRKAKKTKLAKPKRKMKVKDEEGKIQEETVSRESDQLELDIFGEDNEAVFVYKEQK